MGREGRDARCEGDYAAHHPGVFGGRSVCEWFDACRPPAEAGAKPLLGDWPNEADMYLRLDGSNMLHFAWPACVCPGMYSPLHLRGT